MAGSQHSYPTGFPNSQQGALRSQFGTGPPIGGLLGSVQQTGMVGQQAYGVAMQPNAQQSLVQQQQQQQNQQLQMQQQQQLQQQQMHQLQQQQAVAQQQQVNQSNQQQQQQQQQSVQQQSQSQQQQPAQNKELNTASLCRYGQETVQDIVSRTQEVFQTLKIIQSLIPLKEEWDMKSDEKKTSESYRLACDESKEIMEQVILKNRHLKEIIDHLRRIIWEINTMLTMRRS
ncbi:Mediator of RNA polymerase II transcription subunit 30 [Gryllus bimaculatus]|nr:Mediator of RNA polymerase II transcription subunit 30 [Gryllus bimaculatus]